MSKEEEEYLIKKKIHNFVWLLGDNPNPLKPRCVRVSEIMDVFANQEKIKLLEDIKKEMEGKYGFTAALHIINNHLSKIK